MKNLILFFSTWLIGLTAIQATPINQATALTAAQKFASAHLAIERAVPQLVYIGQNEAFFVFNIGEHAFVIIAGDDAHRPVIGYLNVLFSYLCT